MTRTIHADEVELRTTAQEGGFFDWQFELAVTGGDGRQVVVVLDGLQVADLILDAKDFGAELKWNGPPVPGHPETGWISVMPPGLFGETEKRHRKEKDA